jgi:hypothetical protein
MRCRVCNKIANLAWNPKTRSFEDCDTCLRAAGLVYVHTSATEVEVMLPDIEDEDQLYGIYQYPNDPTG